MRYALPVVVAAALVLSGCSATSDENAGGDVQSPAVSSDMGKPVEYWAGIIAEQKNELDDWQKSWDAATCSATAILMGNAPDCEASAIALAMTVQTTGLKISATPKDGPVAPEVADLWKETAAIVASTAKKGEALTECSSDCGSLDADLIFAVDDLAGAYARWEPYL